jgi:aspartokinase
MGCGEVVVNDAIAKISVVGMGMINTPGVAARMFAALAQRQINIHMIATSEIKISCLVKEARWRQGPIERLNSRIGQTRSASSWVRWC